MDKYTITMQEKSKYHVLTPKTDLGESEYFEAIMFALEDKSVHNLAISGPYGAGKSSVIHSFINSRKKNIDREKRVLVGGGWPINDITITLGHLCTNADDGIAKDASIGEITSFIRKKQKIDPNLIEYSILEQLFFHDSGANLPESQFSRIKPISLWDLMAYVFYIVFFGTCVFAWFYRNTLGLDFPGYLALIIFSALSSFAVYKLFPIIRNLSIRKISLATASIEIGNGKSQSVLNQHLDEILYYFQQTGINLVIFEDLDRFDNPDLFVKLREINYLINNAASIEQHVVFVYALRDDMFPDKQRTKFFDFIVPIIPYVDGKNAVDKLYTELCELGIENNLCHVLSYHIGDMRMVNNIVNEFQIYLAHKPVEAKSGINKLLAIVAYKNCYPKDFAALLEHKGILYAVMTNKKKVITGKKQEIQNLIKDLKKRLADIKAHRDISIHALRLEYVSALLNLIPFKGVRLGTLNERKNIDEWTEDEEFSELMKQTSVKYVLQNERNSTLLESTFDYSFNEVENEVDPDMSYEEREQMILNREKVDDIQKQISKLLNDLSVLEKSKYASILKDGGKLEDVFTYAEFMEYADSKSAFDEQLLLIKHLLRLDYINENYKEYISLFHKGTISEKDHEFIINVISGEDSGHGLELEYPEQVVKQIDEEYFLSPAVWNFDLVDALMKSKTLEHKVNNLIRSLSSSDSGFNFMNQYVYRGGEEIGVFIERLCDIDTDVWREICKKDYINVDKYYWLDLLLRNARMELIPKLFAKNESIIANDSDYFNKYNIPAERLREIAKVLDIKFTKISKTESEDNKEFLFANSLYVIEAEVMENVVPQAYILTTFSANNFEKLHEKEMAPMYKYVKENISSYMHNVWLKEKPILVSEECVIELIKLCKNEVECATILRHAGTFFNDVMTVVNDEELEIGPFFETGSILPTWENLKSIFAYENEILTDYVTAYLNQFAVYTYLKGCIKPEYYVRNSTSDNTKLARAILYNKSISKETLVTLLSDNMLLGSWEASKLSAEKVEAMIETGKIAPTFKTFIFLREHYEQAHILLLKHNFAAIINGFESSISLRSDEVEMLDRAKLRSLQYKKLLSYIKADVIKEANELSFIVAASERRDPAITFDKAIAVVMNKNVEPLRRIRILISSKELLTHEKIMECLYALGQPYASIPGNYAKIPKGDLNKELLECLREKEYVSSYPLKGDTYYMVYLRRKRRK